MIADNKLAAEHALALVRRLEPLSPQERLHVIALAQVMINADLIRSQAAARARHDPPDEEIG